MLVFWNVILEPTSDDPAHIDSLVPELAEELLAVAREVVDGRDDIRIRMSDISPEGEPDIRKWPLVWVNPDLKPEIEAEMEANPELKRQAERYLQAVRSTPRGGEAPTG